MGSSSIAIALPLFLVVLAPGPAAAQGEVFPAIQKVITMIDNLTSELEEESSQDEAKFNHFSEWAGQEIADTEVQIGALQSKVEELQATISGLKTTKMGLQAQLKTLKGAIAEQQSQINFAKEKRSEENHMYVAEQQEFIAAIAACAKAAKLLSAHYGDGSAPEEAAKPGFLGLLETLRTHALALGKARRHKYPAVELIQKAALVRSRSHLRQPNNDRYQESTGEALNVVDQIKLLKDSFTEDQQSAVEDEARLQKQYDTLMAEKTELLNSLTGERDQQQTILDGTNQEIAKNEGELSRSESQLADAHIYLEQTQTTREEFKEMYESRKVDRDAELEACRQAVGGLGGYRVALAQKSSVLTRMRGQVHGRDAPKCRTCGQAASLLRARAASFHSTLLQAAAAATAGSEAIEEIVSALEGLIDRLHQEQKGEKEHKDWCEKETGLTSGKVEDHSSVVEDLTNVLANLSELLVEEKDNLVQNGNDITDEDVSFEAMEKLRTEEKAEFEKEEQEHSEAIVALNEAIDILAKFYASRKGAALPQTRATRGLARLARFAQPGSGSSAVALVANVRHDFEAAKTHLEKEEDEAVKLFEESKKIHVKEDNDLHSEENVLTVEKQTTQADMEAATNDKIDAEAEVKSAKEYLDQLGKSCYPLMARFEERKTLRKEEEKSIKEAITVLENEA